ncbi:MAG TPA: cyclic nucleotide-binding domain-containing protein [Acidimicrobiia bacterium]|nr:cyclic nucleotide-binding domain-containing protein [Acidimicrobiia bacterium]
MSAADFLKKTALFGGLTDADLDNVLQTSKERSFPEGDLVIEEGAAGRGFYLVLSGTAQVRKGEKVLADLGPGDYFGEMAVLLEDTPRTADVVATSDLTCLVITAWDLRAFITTHPDVGARMMGELLRRLRDTDALLPD